ncbi:MAG TPA: pitrilysin family protein [Thermoanaerobaculia bacterium]|jgi:zinc protease|nr:pitrilysin family protein [Thermoanaerobaculia bacterium]
MKRALRWSPAAGWLAAAALAVTSFLLPAAAARAGEVPGLSSRTLANGLEVIVIENHIAPLVTIEVAGKTGGFVEGPDTTGLSHLYEHMFFKGNEVLPDQEAWLKRVNQLGATWNGTTNTERVNYFITLPAAKLWEGAFFMRDALLHPLFRQSELERERVVVLGEFDRNEANPQYHLGREVDRRLWYRYLTRKSPLGERPVIEAATREQMLAFKQRYYVPNNMALLLAGDVTPAEGFALAEQLFGTWPRAANPHLKWPEPAHPPLTKSSTVAVIAPVKTANLRISWQGPGMIADTPATFAADVLTFILGQPASRFQRTLVDSGLFDVVGIGYFSQVHTGPIMVTGVTSPERLEKAHAALLDELSHVADADDFTDEELAFAKQQLERSEIFSRERPTDYVHGVSFWWSTGGLDYFRHYLDNLRQVSRADVQRYARRYILGHPSVTGVLLAEGEQAKAPFLAGAEVVHPKSGSSGTAMAGAQGAAATTETFEIAGVPVILRKNPTAETAAVRGYLRGGVAFAGAARAGRELMLLEVGSEQTAAWPKGKLARELTRLGATLGSSSLQDYSWLGLDTLGRTFAESLPLFLEALVSPRVDEAEVELVRERRLTRLKEQEEDPGAWSFRLAMENFYGDHPYGLDPLGTAAVVSTTTPADLRRLHDETFTRSRLLLVVVGNVDRPQLEGLLAPALAKLPAGEYRPSPPPPLPGGDQAHARLVSRDLPTVYLDGLFPSPNITDADYAPLYAGMRALGNRLFQEVRTKRNLSYAPFASLRRRAVNFGEVAATTADPAAVLAVMREEIRKMQVADLPADELADQMRSLRTQWLSGLQGSGEVAESLGEFQLLTGNWQSLDRFLAELDAMTPARVRAAMQKYANHLDFTLLGKVEGIDPHRFEGP